MSGLGEDDRQLEQEVGKTSWPSSWSEIVHLIWRGEIYGVDHDMSRGHAAGLLRPGVIISADLINDDPWARDGDCSGELAAGLDVMGHYFRQGLSAHWSMSSTLSYVIRCECMEEKTVTLMRVFASQRHV